MEVIFTMARKFNAIGFDLFPKGFNFVVYYEDGSYSGPTYENVYVQGFRGKTRVANLMFDMGSESRRIELGGPFRNLSSLIIGAGFPDFDYYKSLPGVDYTGNEIDAPPYSHFDIDNVVLAPVPLPAGMPLAASGLGLLALLSRRRRSRVRSRIR